MPGKQGIINYYYLGGKKKPLKTGKSKDKVVLEVF